MPIIVDDRTPEEYRRDQAQEIVDQQNLTDLDDAKAFARSWIETALAFSDDIDYWSMRCWDAEEALAESRLWDPR